MRAKAPKVNSKVSKSALSGGPSIGDTKNKQKKSNKNIANADFTTTITQQYLPLTSKPEKSNLAKFLCEIS